MPFSLSTYAKKSLQQVYCGLYGGGRCGFGVIVVVRLLLRLTGCGGCGAWLPGGFRETAVLGLASEVYTI